MHDYDSALFTDFVVRIGQNLCSRHGVVVVVTGFGSKGLEFKIFKSTCGIRQEGHPEFKVLLCSSKKPGSKVVDVQ